MPRALINVHSFLQLFNPSKFIVYFSLLIFSLLFSLKLDNRVAFSYWLVFLPLWIWKSIALLGAFVGLIVWLKNSEYRASHSSYVHFKSMLISLSLQLLLLIFEILVCDKLETRRHTWTLAFVPLLFISLLSISVCVWSIKNGRGFELELFAAVNILQICLVALKLDNFLTWGWFLVLVPTYIMLCFAIVVVLYAMTFAAIILRSPEMDSEHRRASISSASASSLIFLPLLIFVILLTKKLESLDAPPSPNNPYQSASYFITCLPLFLTLIILIRLSFGSKTGSLWWFGMRTDFCTFLLTICPCLKEYGNTSFTMSTRLNHTVSDVNSSTNINDTNSINSNDNDHHIIRTHSCETGTDQNQTDKSSKPGWFGALSQVLHRDKTQRYQDRSEPDGQAIPKLNIDAPD